MDDADRISELLSDWNDGKEGALEELMPLLYGELRRVARIQMNGQPPGHTFQTTELIHEAYMKLADGRSGRFADREHFIGVAATAMRHILVDYARRKGRQKRGGWQQRVTLADDEAQPGSDTRDLMALDDALNELARLEERKARIVELKYFGGMSFTEIASLLDISTKTVQRDWRFARMWLLREIRSGE